jgi:hypothetical protein
VVSGRWWGPTDLQVEVFSCGEIMGLWSMGLVCLKGTGWQSGDPTCLWIPDLTGLGGQLSGMESTRVWLPGWAGLRCTGLQSGYCAGLCRPWGHGPAEIMQACVGLEGPAQQNGDRVCLYLQLSRPWGGGWQSRDCTGLCRPGGAWPSNGAHSSLCRPGGSSPVAGKAQRNGDRVSLRGGSLG